MFWCQNWSQLGDPPTVDIVSLYMSSFPALPCCRSPQALLPAPLLFSRQHAPLCLISAFPQLWTDTAGRSTLLSKLWLLAFDYFQMRFPASLNVISCLICWSQKFLSFICSWKWFQSCNKNPQVLSLEIKGFFWLLYSRMASFVLKSSILLRFIQRPAGRREISILTGLFQVPGEGRWPHETEVWVAAY